ncbi:MAG: PHP-associated domain-containing protein [Syntrophales bacterium]
MAHRLDEIEKRVTVFEREIRSEQELVDKIHTGRYTIGSALVTS